LAPFLRGEGWGEGLRATSALDLYRGESPSPGLLRNPTSPRFYGRGIAYGFETPIALDGKRDSEDDSCAMEGVGWADSGRLFGGWRTRVRPMHGTICWRCCASRWRRFCVGQNRA